MNEVAAILDQARLFVLQHAPAQILKEAVPFGIIVLSVGIGLSVLGAKLSRFAFVCAFIGLGAWVGIYFARQTGFPTPVCGLVGAALIGLIGYQTFRMWVGVTVALVLSSLALGAFGYQRIVPHVAEFEQTGTTQAVESPVSFELPSPEQQQAYHERTPWQWAEQLWAFVTQKDAHIERNGKAVGLAALVAGLCLGVVATRWALILATSLVGTALVTTAIAALLTHSVPETCQAFQQRPGLVGVAVGGFLVSSFVLQTMLTRKAPVAKAESAAKS